MRLKLFFYLFLILFSSCTHKKTFTEKLSHRIPWNELHLNGISNNIQFERQSIHADFSDLQNFVSEFKSKDENFNLEEFEHQWNLFFEKNDRLDWNEAEVKKWIETTGLLLELTNKTKYAEELENTFGKVGSDLQQLITPYVFTKRVDHIYVNIFQPLKIEYKHSLGGDVTFRQECNYPESGSVTMHFGMTERRYIEIYVRIPEWAEGATVTVKNVKYFTAPGSYCLIAKKWKDGDIVEVELPIDKRPQ
ncbi:glycoside hydrolase family 127 protein [Prolixibacteraceae bacterium Z1-6]|uniref:Glycoside hydrolase family 127 protein n=1 Tax=Draconibacterium aestuarii TaxID=2998507 RepID=A0A9X3J622_9BACT|nr:glycoside hydrolase family 127 protein [Prolixibacteraceae bacterium Z1-6]